MVKEETADYFAGEESSHKPINKWRDDERPREKLMQKGAASLSDSELLGILIGGGIQNLSAVDLGKKLLENHGSITEMAKQDFGAFKKIPGIGDAKAVTISAAFELGRRVSGNLFLEKRRVRTPGEVAEYFIPRMRDLRVEHFYVLLLNTKNQIYREILISKGSLNQSNAAPREVFQHAIADSASSIILVHNHPSGNIEASTGDKDTTKQLIASGKIIGIPIIDHLIIAGDNYLSFAQKGWI